MPTARFDLALIIIPFALTVIGLDAASGQAIPTGTADSSARAVGDTSNLRRASDFRPSALLLVTGEEVERDRTDQLLSGMQRGRSLMLRSASSLTPWNKVGRPRIAAIAPHLQVVLNSAIPYSANNGSMWAGKGVSSKTLFGFRLEGSRARLIFAPELVVSANADWSLFRDYYVPALPPDRRQFEFPFYVGRFTIDQPMRFGDASVRRLDPGQTSLTVAAKAFEFGVSNESEWWGPGIRNAIVLSNNAPGFPHFFIRTGRPLVSRFGAIEMRWLVGGLTESQYFDTVSTNNTRSLSAVAATIQTGWDPNLTLGLARSVFGTAHGMGQAMWRWFDVLARTHSDVVDTSQTQRDQILTLFGRWVFPDNGVEMYAEWGRLELQPSLRDFLIAPNHTQGYTIGFQWRGGEWRSGDFRVQSEITQLEESATFRDRPVGSWYTSTRVIQGYTNRGQVIGASIGPGASSQWVATDYLRPSWSVGAYVGRIRWNQDVHNSAKLPVYVGYCSQDVTIYPGIRGGKSGGFGSLTASLSLQNRLTPFFLNGGGCPNNGRRLDIRNQSLSISFSPAIRR